MASNLAVNLNLTGNASLSGPTGLAKPGVNLPLGQANSAWAAMATALGFGSGSGQARNYYAAQRTVGAASSDNLDLNGVLTNDYGEVLSFTAVKLILVSIVSPDGAKKLRVGPQGITNACQLNFGGVTAAVYKEVTNWDVIVNEPVAGYVVTPATGDILGINNPGAAPVTYNILIVGLP